MPIIVAIRIRRPSPLPIDAHPRPGADSEQGGALPAGWTVAWIDGAGHLPHLEKAAEVNAILAKS